MSFIVIAYLIASFAGGSLTTSYVNQNISARDHRTMATIDWDLDHVSEKMNDPACDEPCRIKTDKEYRKLSKLKLKLEKKYGTSGFSGLSRE